MKALVTGGTSGIGYGTAQQLAEQGWDVTIVGRNAVRGESIAKELGGEFIRADLSLMAEVRDLAEKISGPLDALVLCAGIVFPRPEDQQTAEGLETVFAINYLSRYLLSQRLLPKMSADGCIIAVSGDGNHKGTSTTWDASLSGMDQAKRAALAVDLYMAHLADQYPSLRVQTSYPGMVRTNLLNTAPAMMRLFVGLMGTSIEKGASYVTRLVTESHQGVHWNKDKPIELILPASASWDDLVRYTQMILQS